MNALFNDIHQVRTKLKALELKIFLVGDEKGIDSEIMDDIADAMKTLAEIEKKVTDATILI